MSGEAALLLSLQNAIFYQFLAAPNHECKLVCDVKLIEVLSSTAGKSSVSSEFVRYSDQEFAQEAGCGVP